MGKGRVRVFGMCDKFARGAGLGEQAEGAPVTNVHTQLYRSSPCGRSIFKMMSLLCVNFRRNGSVALMQQLMERENCVMLAKFG